MDELRKAETSRLNSKVNGKDWYQQTPEERQYNRTIRSPWWARVTRNTLDLATYTLPELFYERQAEQGSDYSVLFPNNVLAPAGASKQNRQALQRAVNHYHVDLYRKYSDRLTVVAGIPMGTPQEAIEELEFAVKTLGLKVANITNNVKRPIKASAEKYPADQAAGIESIEDIRDRWVNSFFFGSESDDRTIAAAFNDKANPLGVKINAIYSSDVGHWDVPDFTDALMD